MANPNITLTAFMNNLSDVCRPNRFFVQILDNGLNPIWPLNFSFYVKTFVIPDKNIGEITLNYQGLQNKFAGDGTFSDVSMTLHVDAEMKIKQFITDWMNGILDTNTEINNNVRQAPDQYRTDIKVQQLDKIGGVVKTFLLHQCWPKTASSIEVSHDSTDTPEDFTVDFCINSWELVD